MKTQAKTLLLIMPPQVGLLSGFSAGLISIANYVAPRQPNVTVKIIDYSEASPSSAAEDLATVCRQFQKSVLFVGITTTTASYQQALALARRIKEFRDDAVVILGGHHATSDYEIILDRHNEVDLIVLGEGELTMENILSQFPDKIDLPGIAYKDKVSKIVRKNPPPALLSTTELDSIPIAYGEYGLIGTPGKFHHATYVSARGCPLKCSFCAVGNEAIRTKSIPAVLRDIEDLVALGYSKIAIEDNFFAHSRTRTESICSALHGLRTKLNNSFTWDCQTRVESLVRPDTITQMEAAGCEAVYIGVESLDPVQLLMLNKTNRPAIYLAKLRKAVSDLLQSKIECYVNIQLGIPGETRGQFNGTLSVLQDLGELALREGRRITVFPQLHVVYPGTVHFQEGLQAGLYSRDIFEGFTAWESQEMPVLLWLGEHFAHGTGGIPIGIMKGDLLKEGRFEVESTRVFNVLDSLRQIAEVEGINVFKYGEYLVSAARSN
ncbi:MAG: B12-binding domain-containing radical SAM protein [Blastocatellia bacterium]|nr:B12-binding domain-containing radical SAM protein [Blastocatellia bacterium]